MAHKMGKQPEEAGNFHSKIPGKVDLSSNGQTTAAGFAIAASGKAIGDPSATVMSPNEKALYSYTRKSSGISDQSPTARLGDKPRS